LARASTHPTTKATLGEPVSLTAMEAVLDQPGPLVVETVISAKWTSSLGGLINLKHERARQLQDGPEAVVNYFHGVKHPTAGWYLVDTGVETALRNPQHPLRSNDLGKAYGFDHLDVITPLGEWLAKKEVAGVFLTHLHLDHVLGLPDIGKTTAVYSGLGETQAESEFYTYSQGTVDALFEQRPPIGELDFETQPVLDVFGDGSFFALATPGHTPGSVAYVARTAEGAVLFTGDVCHTAWGWNHDVEPGTFSHDHGANAKSLALLRALAARHPSMQIRLGHQAL
jgi:glyoxylase-like metal-dependent hydrolase (beta-lactamase superfamily II)